MATARRVPGWRWALLSVALTCGLGGPARASVTAFVGEPFGRFGTMMPVGHTTIYLDRVCADGPLKLRMCRAGEPAGVAIARYDHLGEVDWIATPVLDFFYGSEEPGAALSFATPEAVQTLRTAYRHEALGGLFPDAVADLPKNNEWVETVGVAYDRRLWGYELATSEAQDEALVAELNGEANHHRYRLRHANCADFAAGVLNFYYPGMVRDARVADFGILSPKEVARRVAAYGTVHPEAGYRVVEVDQVPGTLRRSRPVRFGSEMFLTTKRYVFTLAVIQPEAVLVALGAWLGDGRWKIGRGAVVEGFGSFVTAPGGGLGEAAAWE